MDLVLVIGLIFLLVLTMLAAVSYWTHRPKRLAARNRIECGLRVIEGRHDGLTTGWRNGTAAVTPGRIRFAGTVGGVRFLRRKPVSIQVDTIDRSHQRSPSGAGIVWVSPNTTVFVLRTPSATLEWAVLPNNVRWAVQQLHPLDT